MEDISAQCKCNQWTSGFLRQNLRPLSAKIQLFHPRWFPRSPATLVGSPPSPSVSSSSSATEAMAPSSGLSWQSYFLLGDTSYIAQINANSLRVRATANAIVICMGFILGFVMSKTFVDLIDAIHARWFNHFLLQIYCRILAWFSFSHATFSTFQWHLLAVWSSVFGGHLVHDLLCAGDQREDNRGDPADVLSKSWWEKEKGLSGLIANVYLIINDGLVIRLVWV